MSRHRHTVNIRADGMRAALGPLLRDERVVRSAVLVDVDSGMVLDAWSAELDRSDLEVLGAGYADLLRATSGGPAGPVGGSELVLSHGGRVHHVVRTVPDPHGDRLALAVVVTGRRWVLWRARRRLRSVSVAAVTAGPSISLRPGTQGWDAAVTGPAPRPPEPVGPHPPVSLSGAVPAGPPVPPPVPAGGDPALLSLAGPRPDSGPRVAAALPGLGPGVPGASRPAGPPVLRSVPHPVVPASADPGLERPRAPLPALAPSPKRRTVER